MTGNIGPAAVTHDVADRARSAWPSGRFSNIPVCGDFAHRNTPDDGQNRVFE
jgi:hypothetical protein